MNNIIIPLATISLAALLQTSFQLSVSVLTLLSGHAISAKHSHQKLIRLITSFVVGAILMTLLLLAFLSLVSLRSFYGKVPTIVWAGTAGLLFGVGLLVWIFYYRPGKGTSLWIPRAFAIYLNSRAKATRRGSEAFGLGLTSVIGELPFVIAPLVVSALVLSTLPANWQLVGLGIYTLLSSLSVLIVWVLIGSGHKLSQIQRWRETNKYFLQFSAGCGLIVLAIYTYVNQVAAGGIF